MPKQLCQHAHGGGGYYLVHHFYKVFFWKAEPCVKPVLELSLYPEAYEGDVVVIYLSVVIREFFFYELGAVF